MQYSQVYCALAVLILPNKFLESQYSLLDLLQTKKLLFSFIIGFVANNFPSQSLLDVRGIKGRVSSKKRSSPQSGSLSVRNFGILVPNLGEVHKFWSRILLLKFK